MKNFTYFLFMIGFCLLTGCATSQSSSNGMTYRWNGSGADVYVTEDDFHIHMPTTFPAGNETFHITNSSNTKHNFKINGNGVEQSLPEEIPGLGSAVMNVTLTPGTYHILCPILGHADLGMRLDVTVTQGH